MYLLIIHRIRVVAAVCLLAIVLLCVPVFCGKQAEQTDGRGTVLPILMYHHVLKNPNMLGEFVISPGELEADLQYLKENGYQTVGVNAVLDYVHRGVPLPEKPVMISFDDGYLSFCEYVLPLLEQYDAHAVLSVIGTYSDLYTEKGDRNVAYAHVSWQDVRLLAESGRVDLENHSYNLHEIGVRRGSMQKKGESDSAYQMLLEADLNKTQERIVNATGIMPLCYTYPYGFISDTSRPVVEKMGFQMTLSCREGINQLSDDPTCLSEMRRYNRPHGKSAAVILKKVLGAP